MYTYSRYINLVRSVNTKLSHGTSTHIHTHTHTYIQTNKKTCIVYKSKLTTFNTFILVNMFRESFSPFLLIPSCKRRLLTVNTSTLVVCMTKLCKHCLEHNTHLGVNSLEIQVRETLKERPELLVLLESYISLLWF